MRYRCSQRAMRIRGSETSRVPRCFCVGVLMRVGTPAYQQILHQASARSMGKWCTPLRSICVSLSPSDGTHGCVLVAGDTSTPVVLADTVGNRVWGQHLVPINSLTNSHPHMLLNAAHPVSILHGIDGYLQPTLKVGHVLGVW